MTSARARIVLDTNALVSRLLSPDSVPGRAVRQAVRDAQILLSQAVLEELVEVLSRSKFDPYVTIQDRQQFLRLLSRIADTVPIIHTVHECRDPRDNKFLELAVNGDAGFIVTGDRDLLALDPFRTIRIITPASHLAGA